MDKRKKKIYIFAFIVMMFLSFGLVPSIVIEAAGLSWNTWKTEAVGDVWWYDLDNYWTMTSSPISGYENKIWSSGQDVIDCQCDYYDNSPAHTDAELIFTTYSSSSLMGIYEFESKAAITDTETLVFKGRYGTKFTYAGIRTVGYIQIYDQTSSTTIWSEPIVTSGSQNVWDWQEFSDIIPLNKYHEYTIKLIGRDVWSSQKVEVAWECTEPWFYAPDPDYGVPLSHSGHTWRYEWRGFQYYAIYECRFHSDLVFHSEPLADLMRDHRPYALNDKLPSYKIGDPTGWDPCYLHEFRSTPYTILEFDDWYSTDLPGYVYYTKSSLLEQIDDNCDEVEIYTKNPELLNPGWAYFVTVRYTVWETGSFDMYLEAELGNEADTKASISPPAYPVAGIEIMSDSYSHSQKSHPIWPMTTLSSSNTHPEQNHFRGTSLGNISLSPISYIESHDWYDIIIVGVNPAYLKVFTRINVNSRENLDAFLVEKNYELENNLNQIADNTNIPATITFDGVVSVDRVLELVKKYKLNINRFRFTAQNGSERIIRGQGTPLGDEVIPIDELKDFVSGYSLLGIQSLDIIINTNVIKSLTNEQDIISLDFAAFLATMNAGIDIDEFIEVQLYTDDVSWYLSFSDAE
jgi:hypothetical protein